MQTEAAKNKVAQQFDRLNAQIDVLEETNKAMESVLAKIGDHFGVTPGDVAGLLAAVEKGQATDG